MRTLFLLALAIQGGPQEDLSSLSLKQAIEVAQQRNPAIAAARQRVEAARGHLSGARALPNPIIAKSVAGTMEEGPAFLVQTFDVLGKLAARSRSASAQLRVARAELEATQLLVSTATESAYVELQAGIKARDLIAEGVRLARALYEKAQTQLEAGDVPRSHLVRTRLELGRLEQGLTSAEAELAVKSAELNTLMARDPSVPVVLSEELRYEVVPIDERALLQTALARRPELLAAREEVKSRQALVSLARAQRNPDLVFQARRAGDGLDGQNTFVGLAVALPLFDWGSVRGAVREAKASVGEQAALTEQLENLIKLEVESALARVKSARQRAENYQRQVVPDADELTRMMLVSYPEGATILEVIDAQRTATSTKIEAYEAITNYRKALAELRRALGGEIPTAQSTSRRDSS